MPTLNKLAKIAALGFFMFALNGMLYAQKEYLPEDIADEEIIDEFVTEDTSAGVAKTEVTHKVVSRIHNQEDDALSTREWNFLKARTEEISKTSGDSALYNELIRELSLWLNVYDESSYAQDVLWAKANLQMQNKDYKGACVSLVKHLYLFPKSKLSITINSALLESLQKRSIPQKYHDPVATVRDAAKTGDKEERLTQFLNLMAFHTDDIFYEAMVKEFETFFMIYPDSKFLPDLTLSLGNLHASSRNFESALLQYSKIMALYPQSIRVPAALLQTARVYADHTKKPELAMDTFQTLVNKYPASAETRKAYTEMAQLAASRKQYQLAVEVYDKITTLYPNTDDAYAAYNAQIEIYNKRLDNYDQAMAIALKVAVVFQHNAEKVVPVLNDAAKISEKKRDYAKQLEFYNLIARDYPNSVEAPKALFDAAKVYEKIGETDNAVTTYQKIADDYSGNSYASDAQKRLNKLR